MREGGREGGKYVVMKVLANSLVPRPSSPTSPFAILLYNNTVEPLNKDTFGTSHFVLSREVVLFQR